MKTVFDRKFGLKISDEALRGSIEVAKVELEAMFPNGILGDDAIDVLKRFYESGNPKAPEAIRKRPL